MGHEFAVGFENFEGHLKDFIDESPQLPCEAFGDGNICQIAEYVVKFSVFFYILLQRLHTIIDDDLKTKPVIQKKPTMETNVLLCS